MRILIVEDISEERRLLRYIAEKHGHEVIEAANGLEGIEMASVHKPDLIISDALMPVMDGFHFLREVKADETLKSIPFIFYSAIYRGDRDVNLAISLGADGYIIKPKEPKELWEEVEIILKNRKKEKAITAELIEEEEEYLKKYSEVVATKLEEKIRELDKAKAKIEEQSRIMEAFFRHTVTPLAFLDREFNFIRVNEAYARVDERDVSEFPGHNHFEFYPSDAIEIFKQVVETKKSFQAVARPFVYAKHPERGITYWDWTLVPILDDKGEVEFLVFSLNNVTQRKLAEEKIIHLNRLYAVLSRVNEAIVRVR